jgi:hypothetical protein
MPAFQAGNPFVRQVHSGSTDASCQQPLDVPQVAAGQAGATGPLHDPRLPNHAFPNRRMIAEQGFPNKANPGCPGWG